MTWRKCLALTMTFSFFAAALVGCDKASPYLHGKPQPLEVVLTQDADGDSPLKLVGERFFRETRFSQYFYANNNGVLNKPPQRGDTVVETLETIKQKISNPYQGQAISCAACHFVDQMRDVAGVGVRAYTDLSRRSAIPNRQDGRDHTVRNSMNMVGSAVKDGLFLHNDGEFITAEDLVRASYLGRNLGWFVTDEKTAIHHMAQVIRADDGSFPTETALGGLSFKDLLAGSANVPARFLIPAQYRMDITQASDDEIFAGLVKLVGGYLRSLDYTRDKSGDYKGSPYDLFLRKNNLPLHPNAGESAVDYSTRLAGVVNALTSPKYVVKGERNFTLQQQDFVFTEQELQGLKVFFGKGQCIQCHSAPDFTDHLFHNTGASQDDYENIHGAGTFAQLNVPDLATRNAHVDVYLPASAAFPQALSMLRSSPVASDTARADLGAWVVFANPAMPKPQALLREAICKSLGVDCSLLTDAQVLDLSVAMIKTPTVRDLGQSDPYLHTGQADQIENVLDFYIKYSALARAGKVRNGDPKLSNIQLSVDDKAAVTLFLKSLNEDYD